jgi:predicted HAD superfamily Cof-like phosphohydrolase
MSENRGEKKFVVKRPTIINRVANWTRIGGLPTFKKPTIPDSVLQGQHYDHIVEEVEELRTALNRDVQDITEIADAAGDILWTALRFCMIHGIDVNYVMTRIYESNMSKYCHSEEEAQATVAAYAEGTHPDKEGVKIEAYYVTVDNDRYYVVKRSDTNKVLKSINYVEPDFSELLPQEAEAEA